MAVPFSARLRSLLVAVMAFGCTISLFNTTLLTLGSGLV